MEWQRAIHLCQVQVKFSITFCSICLSEPLHISVRGLCPANPPLASLSSDLQYSYGPHATLLRMRNHMTTSSMSMCAVCRSPFQMTTSDDSTASTGGNATAHNKTAEVPVTPVTSSTEDLRHPDRLEKTGLASALTQAPSRAPAAALGRAQAAQRLRSPSLPGAALVACVTRDACVATSPTLNPPYVSQRLGSCSGAPEHCWPQAAQNLTPFGLPGRASMACIT